MKPRLISEHNDFIAVAQLVVWCHAKTVDAQLRDCCPHGTFATGHAAVSPHGIFDARAHGQIPNRGLFLSGPAIHKDVEPRAFELIVQPLAVLALGPNASQRWHCVLLFRRAPFATQQRIRGRRSRRVYSTLSLLADCLLFVRPRCGSYRVVRGRGAGLALFTGVADALHQIVPLDSQTPLAPRVGGRFVVGVRGFAPFGHLVHV
mmetsp:Transcript_9796/g.19262  ORF Transcript_9796/g.19262 Transcript_9796/m.19262 type:complete len:205 (+) Transcript_9796:286-900(+)